MVNVIKLSTEDEYMKRLFLVASLCSAAFVVAPITSASAEAFKSTGNGCFVQGKATFVPKPLGFGKPVADKYSFEAENVESENSLKGQQQTTTSAVECEGETVKNKEKGPWKGEKAEVTGGEGSLECGINSKNTKEGTAKIKLKNTANGKEFTFESKFKFTATVKAGEIKAELENAKGEKASGPANFTGPKKDKAKAAEACLKEEAVNLNFETASQGGTEIGITGVIGE